MRRALGMAAAIAAAVLAAGCGHASAEDPGPSGTRNFQVGGFQKIAVSGPFEVQVRTGGAASVSAKGPQKILDRMLVEVQGDTLMIRPRPENGGFHWNWGHHDTINVAVTTPELRAAHIDGSGGVRVDQVKGQSFDGGVRGSGDLSVAQLDVQSLSLAIGGSGDVRAESGRAQTVELTIKGSGDIDAKGVAAESANATIGGSGNISAQATGSASVNVMGSGNVEITGGAKCTVNKAGSGDVRCS
ncbi:MAG: head GIN domain-containing protein [Sphingomicrobium sp.]